MLGKCDICNKQYKVRHIAEYNRNKKHYCSYECYNIDKRKSFINNFNKMQEGQYQLINYIDTTNVIIKCNICGNIYSCNSRNLIQYKKPCKVCKDNKRKVNILAKAIINNQLNIIADKRKELNQLVDRLTKALDKIKRKEIYKQNIKAKRKRAELKRENRIKNNGLIDKDITLEKLYIRDKGICYICNERCNYDDYKLTNEGYFIAGLKYPSIDHIIPLNKGGTHTWNNVKLAHFICNSLKKDKLYPRPSN